MYAILYSIGKKYFSSQRINLYWKEGLEAMVFVDDYFDDVAQGAVVGIQSTEVLVEKLEYNNNL